MKAVWSILNPTSLVDIVSSNVSSGQEVPAQVIPEIPESQGAETATRVLKSIAKSFQLNSQMPDRSSEEWNRLGKLVLLSALSALGTLGNIFAISAVMTDEQLKKKGNALLVNLMLAGLLITAGVLPADIVALLAGWRPPTPACQTTWVFSCLAAHTSLVTLPCVAWENRTRLSGRSISTAGLIALVFTCWLTSASLTCAQWVGDLGPSHCGSTISPDAHIYKVFTSTVGVVLVLAPLALAIAVHASTLSAAHTNIRPPRRQTALSSGEIKTFIHASSKELALPGTNLAVSAIAGSCWAVGVASNWWADDEMRYSLSWFPLGAATATGFLYGAHKPFRDAYVQLFHYCCCKTSVSLAHRGRNDAAVAASAAVTAAARPAGDVRVHIIPGYNLYTTSAAREHRTVQNKQNRSRGKDHRRPKVTHKCDVYEL